MQMILKHGDVSIDAGVFATTEDCLFGVPELESHLKESPKFYGNLIHCLSQLAAVRMTEPAAKLASITVDEFEKSTDLIPPTGLAGNEAPIRRLLKIARKGLAAGQFGTARVFKALAIAQAGYVKKALAPHFVERERAAKAEAVAERQRLLAKRRAERAVSDPDLIRQRQAMAKAAEEAQLEKLVDEALDRFSKGIDKMKNDLADINRQLHRLENQRFDAHVAAQPPGERRVH